MVRLDTSIERRGLSSHDLLMINDNYCLSVINSSKYTIFEYISFYVITLNVLCIRGVSVSYKVESFVESASNLFHAL